MNLTIVKRHLTAAAAAVATFRREQSWRNRYRPICHWSNCPSARCPSKECPLTRCHLPKCPSKECPLSAMNRLFRLKSVCRPRPNNRRTKKEKENSFEMRLSVAGLNLVYLSWTNNEVLNWTISSINEWQLKWQRPSTNKWLNFWESLLS